MYFAGHNFDFELICKYFSGTKDTRFGDVQSLHPFYEMPESVPGIFRVQKDSGFINLTLDDDYLLSRIHDYAQSPVCFTPKNTFDVSSPEYLLYLFGIYVDEIWSHAAADKNDTYGELQKISVRRIAVMAFYLIEATAKIEKDPHFCESFQKLYDTFSYELYKILTAGILKETPSLLRKLTVCALKLSINIPAYREA